MVTRSRMMDITLKSALPAAWIASKRFIFVLFGMLPMMAHKYAVRSPLRATGSETTPAMRWTKPHSMKQRAPMSSKPVGSWCMVDSYSVAQGCKGREGEGVSMHNVAG